MPWCVTLTLLLLPVCVRVCACTVYKKLKEGTQQVSWKAEEEEEFEDADGNVLSRKMYDDMVREGIIQA